MLIDASLYTVVILQNHRKPHVNDKNKPFADDGILKEEKDWYQTIPTKPRAQHKALGPVWLAEFWLKLAEKYCYD